MDAQDFCAAFGPLSKLFVFLQHEDRPVCPGMTASLGRRKRHPKLEVVHMH